MIFIDMIRHSNYRYIYHKPKRYWSNQLSYAATPCRWCSLIFPVTATSATSATPSAFSRPKTVSSRPAAASATKSLFQHGWWSHRGCLTIWNPQVTMGFNTHDITWILWGVPLKLGNLHIIYIHIHTVYVMETIIGIWWEHTLMGTHNGYIVELWSGNKRYILGICMYIYSLKKYFEVCLQIKGFKHWDFW